jgi:hypothetical protein
MPIRHLSPSGQFVSREIWTTFKSLIASDFGLVASGFIVGGDAKKARSKPSNVYRTFLQMCQPNNRQVEQIEQMQIQQGTS